MSLWTPPGQLSATPPALLLRFTASLLFLHCSAEQHQG
jgi:hypothetical protein